MDQSLFKELSALATEQRNPLSNNVDRATVWEILDIINLEDHRVPIAVREQLPYIEKAVHIVVESFKAGGRLIYVGAGTSGRLGILDASECPPTFGVPPEMVQGVIAGGREAVFKAVEGAEDSEEMGRDAMRKLALTPNDVVCGIAASKRTPFVVAAVEYARQKRSRTVFITCSPRETLSLEVDVAICPVVGPEVVMGSTRMKSGTAQKLVLNMLTTAAMIRMGKTYENMMIDLQMTNRKLVERSRRIVMMITGVDYESASAALEASNGHVKTTLVMLLKGVDLAEAQRRLAASEGFVRAALQEEATL